MPQDRWTAVDRYLGDLLIPEDAVLEETIRASTAAGLPPISISRTEGRLLAMLARMVRANAILEIGTLGGYSAIWLARALQPGGRLITLEAEPKHATVARSNIARAGLSGTIDVRLGPALESLPRLVDQRLTFDLIFIDADKTGYPDYWGWALKLARPGALIVADNVVRDGAVADASSNDPNVRGVRQYHALVAAEPRVTATVLQTVGAKGYDGMSLALVLA